MTTLANADARLTETGPIRVGFVLHVMQVAGAEMLVAETIRRLGERIEPTIFCLDAVGDLGERLRGEGVEVVPLGRRPGRDLGVARRLANAARARRVEVLHAHQYTPFFYSALAKLLARPRPRLILTEHGRHYPDVVSGSRRLANRLVLGRLADAITGVCDFSVRGLCENDGFSRGGAVVIENGIDVDRYGPAPDKAALRVRLGLDPGRKYVLAVARFHPVKGHGTLIRGFREVAASRPDVDLLLAGDGALRDELERLATQLGISGRVRFLGVRGDVPDLLRAADVFAMTSESEAASLTIMEAMATGVPVVVTRVGGNPELVRDGIDGLLVPRGDSAATAQALARILDDPSAAAVMGDSGRERAGRRYRLDRTVGDYLDLYRRLVRPDGPRARAEA